MYDLELAWTDILMIIALVIALLMITFGPIAACFAVEVICG